VQARERVQNIVDKTSPAGPQGHVKEDLDLTKHPVGTPENPSDKILTVSNVITMTRLALTLVFLWLFVTKPDRYLALNVYVVASTTDFLDGWIARRTQTVSWFGKQLDPIVDRALLITGVLGLLIRGDLPVWIPLYVIIRDIALAFASARLRGYTSRPLDVVYTGKIATAMLMIGFCFLLYDKPEAAGMGLIEVSWLPGINSQPAPVGIFFVYAGVVFSIIATVTYFWRGFHVKWDVLGMHGYGEDGEETSGEKGEHALEAYTTPHGDDPQKEGDA